MAPIDYHVLDFFEEHDITASPKVIAVNVGYDQQYCSKRCRVLEEHGLLERPEKGLYRLSERGRAYLNGELETSDIDPEAEDN